MHYFLYLVRLTPPITNTAWPGGLREAIKSTEASLRLRAVFGGVEQSPWGLRNLRTPSGGCLQGGKGVLNTLSSAGPPPQKTQNFVPVQAPLPFFSKMCAFTLSARRMGRATGAPGGSDRAGTFSCFFKCFFNTLQEPQKIDLTALQEAS